VQRRCRWRRRRVRQGLRPSRPGRPDTGCVIGHPGEPGDPEIDLSPPTYNYSHRIVSWKSPAERRGGDGLDGMLETLGAAIAADPFLGGLCDYLRPKRPTSTTAARTVASTNWATVPLVAEYSTNNA
jgi:hypothetical protein